MRWLIFWLFLGLIADFLPVAAQDTIVQEFSGSGPTTTALFKVNDRWEVRWNARQVVSVAVMSSNGVIVAGAAGVLRGSLFVPRGGSYYLHIDDGTVVRAPKPGPPANPAFSTPSPASETEVSWHLQVAQLGKTVASNQALTVYTPFFVVPDSAITTVVPPPPAPPPTLSPAQAQAMVTIKGDNAQGLGFLMRAKEGTFVVTSLHLLAANPNVKLTTSSGATITPVSLKGATDHDLALFTIEDDHYSYLPRADASSSVATGDPVIIPNLVDSNGTVMGVNGNVVNVAPDRIDFTNVLARGSSGAPVIHVKSGNVLAMVANQKQVNLSNHIAQAWPANPAPGAAGIIPYYGVRLNAAQDWETYDWSRFISETLFLKHFHETTRALDSYLNGGPHGRQGDDDRRPPDNQYFMSNDKIKAADATYKQVGDDADQNEKLDATRELLFDLQGVTDSDMNSLQATTNSPYSYDRTWANEELAYRNAVKKQLSDLSDHIVGLEHIVQLHELNNSPSQ